MPAAKRKGRPSNISVAFTKGSGRWSAADAARLFKWASPRTPVPPPTACERMAQTLNGLKDAAPLPLRRKTRRSLADAARVLLREIGVEAEAWEDGTHPAQRWLFKHGPNRVRGAQPVEETGILSLLPAMRERASGEAAAALRALDVALHQALPWLDLRAPGTAEWHGSAYVVACEFQAAWLEAGQKFGIKHTSPVVAATAEALRLLRPSANITKDGIAAAIKRFVPLPIARSATRRGDKSR